MQESALEAIQLITITSQRIYAQLRFVIGDDVHDNVRGIHHPSARSSEHRSGV